MCTLMHTCSHIHMFTVTHLLMQPPAPTFTHAHKPLHRHAHSHTHVLTHTYILTQHTLSHSPTPAHVCTDAHTHNSLTHTHSHGHTQSPPPRDSCNIHTYTCVHKLTYTSIRTQHALIYTCSHTHAHLQGTVTGMCSHTHSHTLSHTRSHMVSLSLMGMSGTELEGSSRMRGVREGGRWLMDCGIRRSGCGNIRAFGRRPGQRDER